MNIYKKIYPLITKLDPEDSHDFAIKFLKFLPRFSSIFCKVNEYENLSQNLFNLNFANPIGMAAGFDKNAEIISSLANFGFGFIEVGTVTPKPQSGNQKPRIFRLEEDKAIINRLGFNNLGADNFLNNINKLNRNYLPVIGINIGKNKDTKNFIDDYIELLKKFYETANYITINISSPNTANLRDLQNSENLNFLLQNINDIKKDLQKTFNKNTPIFLKIAPDLDAFQLESIANLSLEYKLDAVIISNTTTSRNDNLKSHYKAENGGLSGRPLFKKSTEVLRNFYILTDGKIPLIGVGGIYNALDVYEKIVHGASLVQIYSAFIYEGFALVERIKQELSLIVESAGFKNISEAVGSKVM